MADKHDSGQMLLSGAFLIAVMIVIVTIMLNNIIYSSNVAYVGFMDGSKYEDMSIRHTTEKQISRTYLDLGGAVDDPRFTKCIEDYTRSVNYLVGQKGKYVELVPAALPASSTLTTTETSWRLNVYNKDSKTTYNILTGEPILAAPPSWPPSPVNLPKVQFEKSTYNVNEDQNIVVTVTLTQTSTNDVSVNYKLLAGTATAGSDYTDATGTVTIPAGALTGTFTVAIIDDTDHESTESLKMVLETPVNAFLGVPISADLFIADNDASGSAEHSISFVTFSANRPDTDKKIVRVRLVIRNDGADLNNVNARLIAIGSSGEVLDSKVTPGKIQVVGATFLSGETSSELVWDIVTQNINDELDISVQITADCSLCGLPIIIDSGTLAEV